MTSYAPCSDLHRFTAIWPPLWSTVVHYMEGTVWCLEISPQYGCWGVAPRWCQVVTFDGRSLLRQRWLCVEDDLRNLSVLYRSAVVVARSVAEGETRFCAGGWWLVCYLSHSFSTIMRVWTLQGRQRGWIYCWIHCMVTDKLLFVFWESKLNRFWLLGCWSDNKAICFTFNIPYIELRD